MTNSFAASLAALLGSEERVITNEQVVARLSKDFYWYSPVLRNLLNGKKADIIVQPISTQEIIAVLRYCYANNLPVTPRGAGTGNYGQAVPLYGGVVLDLSRMDEIEAIEPDGCAVCQPGVRLAPLEAEANKHGWELRCYPSTVVKASLGGFLAGGSGGIGSVAHGGLRDFGIVRALEIVTMEAEPRVVTLRGDSIHEILHAWGTNGIITRVWFALAPRVQWAQCAIAFDTFEEAFSFSRDIATSDKWTKRLVTTFEWPLPSYFHPILKLTRQNKALVFVMVSEEQRLLFEAAAQEARGDVTFAAPFQGMRSVPLLSDYTWNHTTLWAMRANEGYTYLQCGFDAENAIRQFAQLKQMYGDEILLHLEFVKTGDGTVAPAAIPVVRFTTERRLNDMIEFCRGIGITVANPHVNNVEGGGRYRADNAQLLAKYRYDAKGLLNPGKMATFGQPAILAPEIA